MTRRPPRSTRTDPLCPYPTLFRSLVDATIRQPVMGNLPSIRKIRLPCITAARDRFSAVELGQRRFDPRHPRLECFAIRACNRARSEEHTSELQSLMRISYAVFCLKKKTN